MKKNKLREHLNSGKPLLSTRMWSTNPLFWEIVGQTGNFDYVEFLAEYAPFDFTDLPNMARAAELNDMGTMIKLDFQGRGYVAQKAVQSGFQSILFVDHKTENSGQCGKIRISKWKIYRKSVTYSAA